MSTSSRKTSASSASRRAPASCTADDMQGGCSRSRASAASAGRLHADHQRARGRDPRRVAQRSWQPVYNDGKFVPRLMLPLSLSYDHRVIDGAEGRALHDALGEIARRRRPARGGDSVSQPSKCGSRISGTSTPSRSSRCSSSRATGSRARTPLITLETDKATMDVPAPRAGIVRVGRAQEGRQGFRRRSRARRSSASRARLRPSPRRRRKRGRCGAGAARRRVAPRAASSARADGCRPRRRAARRPPHRQAQLVVIGAGPGRLHGRVSRRRSRPRGHARRALAARSAASA